uniref:Uncharacterized protein n=1 Tax=Rhizophora mucronata TaxID=61149 RepID=A0A2P2L4D9_RHIMU
MRFQTTTMAIRVSEIKNRAPCMFQSLASPHFSQLQSCHHGHRHERASFGIAFDIDGVILRGRAPIGGSPQALRRLYTDSGSLKFPFLFLTNGEQSKLFNELFSYRNLWLYA